MKRILHLAESAMGGVGAYLNQVMPNLRGVKQRVLLPASDSGILVDVDPTIVTTYDRRKRSVPDLLRFAFAARDEIKRFRPDIIHLHSTFAGLIGRPLIYLIFPLRISRPHVIYSPHGWAFDIPASPTRVRIIVAVEQALATLTDHIVVLSEKERAECLSLGLRSDKVVRIYNGVAAEPKAVASADWADDRLKVLFVGRFDRQKGLDVLLAAAAQAQDRIVVRCAGAPVADSDASATIPPNVTIMGWLSERDIQSWLSGADVIAMPSRWEGFGLVAIEAMRSAKPVVATCVGGLPEVVENGVTGRLIQPNDPHALAAALLGDNAQTRHKMGQAGRTRFLANFTIAHCVGDLERLYLRAI